MNKPLMIATALTLLTTCAMAEDRATCLRDNQKIFGLAAAKRVCNPKNYVKAPQLGWGCEEFKFVRIEGGARLKRDAVCE